MNLESVSDPECVSEREEDPQSGAGPEEPLELSGEWGQLHHGARGSTLRLTRLHLLHLQDHPPEHLDGCLRNRRGDSSVTAQPRPPRAPGGLTWFSLAEDSRNAAFHESARALPSSKLIILPEHEQACQVCLCAHLC